MYYNMSLVCFGFIIRKMQCLILASTPELWKLLKAIFRSDKVAVITGNEYAKWSRLIKIWSMTSGLKSYFWHPDHLPSYSRRESHSSCCRCGILMVSTRWLAVSISTQKETLVFSTEAGRGHYQRHDSLYLFLLNPQVFHYIHPLATSIHKNRNSWDCLSSYSHFIVCHRIIKMYNLSTFNFRLHVSFRLDGISSTLPLLCPSGTGHHAASVAPFVGPDSSLTPIQWTFTALRCRDLAGRSLAKSFYCKTYQFHCVWRVKWRAKQYQDREPSFEVFVSHKPKSQAHAL